MQSKPSYIQIDQTLTPMLPLQILTLLNTSTSKKGHFPDLNGIPGATPNP